MASYDPEFEAKAADILGLYVNPPQHAAVFCVDKKSAIQALDRLDPVLPLSPGRAERHGFEYYRHGTLSLYAALDVKTGDALILALEGNEVHMFTPREAVRQFQEMVRQYVPDGRSLVDELIAGWTRDRTRYEAMETLGAAGVPAGAVLDTEELLCSPQLVAREMVVEVEHPQRGRFRMLGCPVKLRDSPPVIATAPVLGQHAAEVCGELFGVDTAAVERLRAEGVV